MGLTPLPPFNNVKNTDNLVPWVIPKGITNRDNQWETNLEVFQWEI